MVVKRRRCVIISLKAEMNEFGNCRKLDLTASHQVRGGSSSVNAAAIVICMLFTRVVLNTLLACALQRDTREWFRMTVGRQACGKSLFAHKRTNLVGAEISTRVFGRIAGHTMVLDQMSHIAVDILGEVRL